ncbi:DUF2274 domain-containing protein [Pandoraea sputorum]|uniref:DUF2274 domain-containing protein n=1 Tax=Pandoraea sputorum TaxID=93222 RepID=UPI001242DACA|nr:DUF2274 domain-containing protein [Pandoraea sputorum]VVE59596.1 hypothetical protein PSP20601_05583 [Pandoraea sputorum]
MTQKSPRSSSPRLMLPIVKREPEKAKLQMNLPQAVHTELRDYQRAYQEMNEVEISLDFIIEHILIQHMKRDKAFQTWKVTNAGKADV